MAARMNTDMRRLPEAVRQSSVACGVSKALGGKKTVRQNKSGSPGEDCRFHLGTGAIGTGDCGACRRCRSDAALVEPFWDRFDLSKSAGQGNRHGTKHTGHEKYVDHGREGVRNAVHHGGDPYLLGGRAFPVRTLVNKDLAPSHN